MRPNRIMSVILMLTFVFSSVSLVGLADSTTASSSVQPKFEVIGTTIKNDDKYFELTMKVTPGSKGFFSAGMTLQYDKGVITPVAWDSNGTVVPMSGCNDWQNVAVVPAVCPTEISGKTAFAYEATPKPTSTEEPAEPTQAPTEAPTEEPIEEQADEEPTETPTNEPTEEPSTEIDEANRGYLYISAEAPLPINAPLATETPAPTETPTPTPTETTDPPLARDASEATPVPTQFPNNGRIITVRFKYVGADAEAIKASKQKVIDGFDTKDGEKIVKLAPDDVAEASPAGQMVFYGAGDEDDTEYYYTTDNSTTIGVHHDELLDEAPVFILEKDGESANTGGGGGDPSKFAALVFFDWDESTLLGSMVVDGAASSEEIINYTNEFALGLIAPEDDGSMPELGEDWAKEKARDWTKNDTTPADDGNGFKYPLSSHEGYTFGKWIEFNSEDYTIYGRAVLANSSSAATDIEMPKDPDYTKISGGLVLKAAYMANTKMDDYTTEAEEAYTVTTDYAPEAGYITRFGTSSNYSIKFDAKRINRYNNPVHRLRTTALRVVYKVGDAEIYSLVNMKNVDEQTVEIATPANATSVSVAIIDIGGVSNWSGGSAARSTLFSVNSAKTDDDNLGYVICGTVNYINQQVAEEGVTTFGAGIFNDASLDVSRDNVYGTTATGGGTLRTQAVTNIRTEQEKKLTAEGTYYLSWKEMAAAIKYGDYKHAYP